MQTLSKASVVLLVLDATSPATKQDLALAQKAVEEGRALVVALNKMDAVDNPQVLAEAVQDRIQRAVWLAGGVPCIPISAKTTMGLRKLMPAV